MVKIRINTGGEKIIEVDDNVSELTPEEKASIRQAYDTHNKKKENESRLQQAKKICKYFECFNLKGLILCPYCHDKYCKIHITPKPTMEAPFINKVPKEIVEQWRNPNAHPCGNYTRELKEAERLSKTMLWVNYPLPEKWKKKVEESQYDHDFRSINDSVEGDMEKFREIQKETYEHEKKYYQTKKKNPSKTLVTYTFNSSHTHDDYEKLLFIIAIVGSLIIIILGALGFFK